MSDNAFERKLVRGNILDGVSELRKTLLRMQQQDIQADTLDEVSQDLGTVLAGELRYGEGDPDDPENPFSGMRILWPPQEFPAGSGRFWTLLAMGANVLQVGIDATSGRLLAAAGAWQVGTDGQKMSGVGYYLEQEASGLEPRVGRMGMETIEGQDNPSWMLRYVEPADAVTGTNLDFESGTLSGWTVEANSWGVAMVENSHWARAALNATAWEAGLLSADLTGLSANQVYELRFRWRGTLNKHASEPGMAMWIEASVQWYDASNALIGTQVTVYEKLTSAGTATRVTTHNITSPAGASKARIRLRSYLAAGSLSTGEVLYDDVALRQMAVNNYLGFEPGRGDVITRVLPGSNAPGRVLAAKRTLPAPAAPRYGSAATGGVSSLGVHKLACTFLDDFGETLLGAQAEVTVTNEEHQFVIQVPVGPPGTRGRRLYATTAGGTVFYLLNGQCLPDGGQPDDDNTTVVLNNVRLYDAFILAGGAAPKADTSGANEVLPVSGCVFFDQAMLLAGKTLTRYANTALDCGEAWWNSTNPADGDEYVLPLWLAAGTYTLKLTGAKASTGALLDVYLDGVRLTTAGALDLYASSVTYYETSFSGVAVAEPGCHRVTIRVNGKRSSSSGYRALLTRLVVMGAG